MQFNSDYILLFGKWDKVKYFINSHLITDYFLTRITEIYNGVEPCRSLKCFKNYSTQAQKTAQTQVMMDRVAKITLQGVGNILPIIITGWSLITKVWTQEQGELGDSQPITPSSSITKRRNIIQHLLTLNLEPNDIMARTD